MTNLNSIMNKISREDQKVFDNQSSKLLAEFFNGHVIQVDEKYLYES